MASASAADTPARSRTLFVGQNRALQQLVNGEPLDRVFASLVEAVEADLEGQTVGCILLLDADGTRLRHGAAPSLPESYNRAIDGIAIAPDIGTCCAAAYRNQVVVTFDIEHDPGWAAFRELPLSLGLRAAWSMPIRSADDKVLGTFGMYFRDCRPPTAAEREIVGIMAKTAAIAIEHRATESALRERQAFLDGIIGASADCLKTLDLEGRLQWMSDNGLCMMEVDDFGRIRDADWVQFWQDDETRARAREAIRVARQGGSSRFVGACPTLRGNPRWWDVLLTPIRGADGRPCALLSVSRDITELKNAVAALEKSEERHRRLAHQLERRVNGRTSELASANDRLRAEIAARNVIEAGRRELLQQLVGAQEDERRRISRELHDQAGQSLTALLVGLQSVRSAPLGPAADATLERLERIADAVGKEIHDLALQLRPTALDDLGLAQALAHHVEEWSVHHHVPAQLHLQPGCARRLPPAVETALYRVVQEALTNVAKHANAARVSVMLERRDDHVQLIVEDNGVGFALDPAARRRTGRSLGLRGMEERAALLQGTFEIEAKPGAGTTIFVRIPLPADDAAGSLHD